jgi:hypothetical protein
MLESETWYGPSICAFVPRWAERSNRVVDLDILDVPIRRHPLSDWTGDVVFVLCSLCVRSAALVAVLVWIR